jgi:hypothetical protein
MVVYRHMQIGSLILFVLGIAAAGTAAVLVLAGEFVDVAVIVLLTLAGCMILFGSLTVEVREDRVTVWFGPGLIRKSFPIERIRAVRAVRNKWYYGWGIRLIPHGWMFNVSGLDAVELELDSGRRFRIGTDEPQALLEAIERVMGLGS